MNRKKAFLFIVLNLGLLTGWEEISTLKCFAQNKNIDSLQILIKKNNLDTNKINNINKLCYEYISIGLYDTALHYGNTALQLAEQLLGPATNRTLLEINTIKKSISSSLGNIGSVYKSKGNFAKTLDYYAKGLKISEEINDKKGIARHLGNSGIVYYAQGNFTKALELYLKALKMAEGIGDKRGVAGHLGNIASIYADQNDYPKALHYAMKALKSAEELGSKKMVAIITGNIGVIYSHQGDYAKTQEYYSKALKLAKELGDKSGIARTLGNMGNIYKDHGDYPKALDYYFRSLKMREELGAKDLIATTLSNIGSLYTLTGKFNEAEQYLKKAVSINDSIGALDLLRQTEEILSTLYDTTAQLAESRKQFSISAKNYALSMLYFKKAITLKDTIFSRENKKQLVRKEMNFEFEKKEVATKAAQDKEIAVKESEKKKQKIVIWSVIAGLLLIVAFSLFMFNRWRITKKQKNIIEKQKEKILDSINYAQRIQQSILMEESEIQSYLPNSFIYFQPKDIVSGDFYWFSEVGGSSESVGGSKKENDPNFSNHELQTTNYKLIIAAVDCTGHGVPGAFMSMVGNTLLNQIVNEKGITTPSDILRLLNIGVHDTLHQEKIGALSEDGMDIALCCIDYKNKEVQFAGAQNPLFVVSEKEVIVFKGDDIAIGGDMVIRQKSDLLQIEYTNHTIPFKKQMTIYLSTDGFRDQLGFPERVIAKEENGSQKKFGIQKFKELLLQNQHLDMQKQKEIFSSAHISWKGSAAQTDDILVIGVTIL